MKEKCFINWAAAVEAVEKEEVEELLTSSSLCNSSGKGESVWQAVG